MILLFPNTTLHIVKILLQQNSKLDTKNSYFASIYVHQSYINNKKKSNLLFKQFLLKCRELYSVVYTTSFSYEFNINSDFFFYDS